MIKYANKKRKALDLQPGDFTYLRSDALQLSSFPSRKLAPQFLGPFKVVKRLSNSYRLQLPAHFRRTHPVFHSSLLKPCIHPHDEDTSPTFIHPETAEAEYEVEAILRHRINRRRNNKLEYLIRWKNFDQSEDSWEPSENLTNAREIVLAYNQ